MSGHSGSTWITLFTVSKLLVKALTLVETTILNLYKSSLSWGWWILLLFETADDLPLVEAEENLYVFKFDIEICYIIKTQTSAWKHIWKLLHSLWELNCKTILATHQRHRAAHMDNRNTKWCTHLDKTTRIINCFANLM